MRLQEGAGDNLKILMVSRGTEADNREKANRHGFTFPVVIQPGWRLSKEYGIFDTPVAFLIDEQGVIARDVARGPDEIVALAQVAGDADKGVPVHSGYHQGSANLDDRELSGDPVDVFLAGVAGRSVTPRYWERILPKLDPRLIVPTHYDNFFTPLGRPQDFVARVKLAEVPREVGQVARDARVAALPRIDS